MTVLHRTAALAPAEPPSESERADAGAVSDADFLMGVRAGRIERVRAALETGTSADTVFDQRCALMEACCANEHAVEMTRLLLAHGANAATFIEWIGSPLGWAAAYGQEAVARLLLERGACPIGTYGPNWSPPLVEAARWGSCSLTRLLLEAGADPNERGVADDTALIWAVRGRGGQETTADPVGVVDLLLAAGADPNAADRQELTALHWAALLNRPLVVAPLVAGGADLGRPNAEGKTPAQSAPHPTMRGLLTALAERALLQPVAGAVASPTGCSLPARRL